MTLEDSTKCKLTRPDAAGNKHKATRLANRVRIYHQRDNGGSITTAYDETFSSVGQAKLAFGRL